MVKVLNTIWMLVEVFTLFIIKHHVTTHTHITYLRRFYLGCSVLKFLFFCEL